MRHLHSLTANTEIFRGRVNMKLTTWKDESHLVWRRGKKRQRGEESIVEGEGKETEEEMKQSRGSLSVDRSFRARSINTNLYWILLLPSSLSFFSLTLSLSVIPPLYASSLTPQATSSHTHTYSESSWCLSRWILYSHRGKGWLSASPLPGEERRGEKRREKKSGKSYPKNIEINTNLNDPFVRSSKQHLSHAIPLWPLWASKPQSLPHITS